MPLQRDHAPILRDTPNRLHFDCGVWRCELIMRGRKDRRCLPSPAGPGCEHTALRCRRWEPHSRSPFRRRGLTRKLPEPICRAAI